MSATFKIIEKQSPLAKWTPLEDEMLIKKVNETGRKNWRYISSFFPDRKPYHCFYRYNTIKPGMKTGTWKEEEDKQLIELYNIYGNKWSKISKIMQSRTGKQIRERFLNNHFKKVKKGKLDDSEVRLLIKWHNKYGNQWKKIAEKIEGRTGDMLKSRFKTYTNKKNNKAKKLFVVSRSNPIVSIPKEEKSSETNNNTITYNQIDNSSLYSSIKIEIEKYEEIDDKDIFSQSTYKNSDISDMNEGVSKTFLNIKRKREIEKNDDLSFDFIHPNENTDKKEIFMNNDEYNEYNDSLLDEQSFDFVHYKNKDFMQDEFSPNLSNYNYLDNMEKNDEYIF